MQTEKAEVRNIKIITVKEFTSVVPFVAWSAYYSTCFHKESKTINLNMSNARFQYRYERKIRNSLKKKSYFSSRGNDYKTKVYSRNVLNRATNNSTQYYYILQIL